MSSYYSTYNYNKPEYYCWILILSDNLSYDNSLDNIIRFQFMPHQITDMKAAMYNDVMTIARSAPIKSYTGSGSRTITFNLEFFANPEMLVPGPGPEQIKKWINALRSLTYPQYTTTVLPPKKCIVRIGNQLAMVAILKSINVIYQGDKPWTIASSTIPAMDPSTGLAFYTQIQLVFEEFSPIPYSYEEIVSGKDSETTNPVQNENFGTNWNVMRPVNLG